MEQYLRENKDWLSDDRMRAMFASFKERSADPDLFEQKFAFWRSLIIECARNGFLGNRRLVFTKEDLEVKFRRKGAVPLGLQTVLEEMQRRADLVPVSEFGKSSWGRWLLSIVASPITGAASILPQRTAQKTSLVLQRLAIGVSDELVDEVRRRITSLPDRIVEFDELQTFSLPSLAGGTLGREDLDLVMKYLEDHKRAATYMNAAYFNPDRAPCVFTDTGKPLFLIHKLNQTERQILSVKKSIKSVRKYVEELERKIQGSKDNARTAVKDNEKKKALFFLRQKSYLNEMMMKRLNALNTLETIIDSISSAHTDADVLSSLDDGAKALKTIMKNNRIAEKHTEVMDSVFDALSDYTEIEHAMKSGNDSVLSHITDDDVEAELQEILQKEILLTNERAQKSNAAPQKSNAAPAKDDEVDDLTSGLQSLTVANGEVTTTANDQVEVAQPRSEPILAS